MRIGVRLDHDDPPIGLKSRSYVPGESVVGIDNDNCTGWYTEIRVIPSRGRPLVDGGSSVLPHAVGTLPLSISCVRPPAVTVVPDKVT